MNSSTPAALWRHRVIALAGIVQAAQLVEQLAKTGYLKTEPFTVAIDSLFEQNPVSTEAVFSATSDNLQTLYEGLHGLENLLQYHRDPKHADLLRYILGVLHLQKRLQRNKNMMYLLGTRLEKARQQAQHFGSVHDNVVGNIADIYTDTISTLPYRIQVSGEYAYLQQPRVANQIRSLLLAAIRAATLWRQLGGSRWQLLFHRQKLVELCVSLQRDAQITN